MQQYADIYLLQNYSTCFGGVTAPIIRSIKNCTRSLRYRYNYLYRYSPPTWSDREIRYRSISAHDTACHFVILVRVFRTLELVMTRQLFIGLLWPFGDEMLC